SFNNSFAKFTRNTLVGRAHLAQARWAKWLAAPKVDRAMATVGLKVVPMATARDLRWAELVPMVSAAHPKVVAEIVAKDRVAHRLALAKVAVALLPKLATATVVRRDRRAMALVPKVVVIVAKAPALVVLRRVAVAAIEADVLAARRAVV